MKSVCKIDSKSRLRWSAALAVSSLLWFTSLAHAARGTECILNALRTLKDPQQDSSVELELNMTSRVLNLLTTSNGKVGGLLEGREELPSWFQEWAREKHPATQDTRDLDWDLLDNKTKIHLLQDLSQGRHQRFYSDRQIHGIAVKKQVTVSFSRPTVFLGKHYGPGENVVDLSSVMGGKVEYRGPTEVDSVSGVELHFRGNQSAGQMSNDAWKLLDGLGIKRNHQHVHIVSPLPEEELKNDPEVEPARMADFFRRANLAAEMAHIIQNDGRIATSRTP
jgi:hypothetical protein